ncbi:hypothetical protein K474DRAFT_1654809 [Panus rudis PR-1116 ss-1]|nr:hypothetical protein K474DRAFT_1654809 [Panus rudis PR-1116 ss-1]
MISFVTLGSLADAVLNSQQGLLSRNSSVDAELGLGNYPPAVLSRPPSQASLVGEYERINTQLMQRLRTTQDELEHTKQISEGWKVQAGGAQAMQAMAISAFERCCVLERENRHLKAALQSFLDGSSSTTVQELQKIVSDLTEEVAQYRKREADLQFKESKLSDKENSNILQEMRRQTAEIKLKRSNTLTQRSPFDTIRGNS